MERQGTQQTVRFAVKGEPWAETTLSWQQQIEVAFRREQRRPRASGQSRRSRAVALARGSEDQW